ncbi:Putative MCP methyltransferase CheR [Actinoplanes missouriensis 431]|uniref:protein-glutamate O-methyltransferase n=1 Tax=Actinoplanes missouriensis (strain ATCC 14538 / DSM 43046 / CBS 188.64 / JCM 3121 / NBRC 102363 / NCIMB 12654 / NRRL B-3342 / UNCC 431) TaxID=512565 RepID=I0HIN5_ACTM4|nr:CheR family methyltransferase [Actinoplanes missouriensis]BAL92872.1 Putative MCP methyltransferase CheR [Actinoplanes missouriensis 431]
MTLSQPDFNFVSTLVRREASIVLAPGKEYLVEARLIPVARAVGAANVAEFLADLQRRPNPQHQRKIIDALTTNETSFFRDREPFSALTDVVLPELIKSRASVRKLRFWSAASSSGQEAFSLAITLQESLPAGWSYEIMGTDISTAMVERATKGEYSQVEVNRGLAATQLVQYFERAGAHWRIIPALRKNVTFKHMSLTAPFPPMQPFDVIFLRNVLIYFDVATKRQVLQNAAKILRPDGLLFLGAAETTIGIDDNYERVAAGRTSAYRTRNAVAAGAARRG